MRKILLVLMIISLGASLSFSMKTDNTIEVDYTDPNVVLLDDDGLGGAPVNDGEEG